MMDFTKMLEIFVILLLLNEDSLQASRRENPANLPTFVTSSQVFKVLEYGRVVLPCEVTNPGFYILAWKKGPAVLSAGSVKVSPDERVQLINGFNLEIRNVSQKDSGDYVCQIGTLEPREITHTLDVLVPPNITHVSNEWVEVRKNTFVTLECQADGNPTPNITWSRKNNLLPGGTQTVSTSKLSLDGVDRHHSGIYQCVASNGVGQDASKQIVLHVLYPPEISVEKPVVHTAEGWEAHLVCLVNGENQPQVTWLKDTLIVDTTERHFMKQHGSKNTLIIRQVRQSDFGNYTCVAENPLGRTKKAIQLTGIPKAVVLKGSSKSNSGHSYNLSFEVESFSPVEDFELLYRKKADNLNFGIDEPNQLNNKYGFIEKPFSAVYSIGYSKSFANWHKVKLPAPRPVSNGLYLMTYKIMDLEPKQEYEVKMVAKNKFGKGPFSKPFTFHTTDKDEVNVDVRDYYKNEHAFKDLFGVAGASSIYLSTFIKSSIIILLTLKG